MRKYQVIQALVMGAALGSSMLFAAVAATGPQGPEPEKKASAAMPAVGESSSRPATKAKLKPAVLLSPGAGSQGPSASAPDVDPYVYRIGSEDELQISVWRESELSQAVVVRPDGMITLPLINELHVVGLTTQELQALLTTKLKAFVNEPQITVIVRAIRSRKVYLFGEVPRPGAYTLGGRKTILQLIAEAGGVGPYAKTSSIYILRNQGGRQTRIPFNYRQAIRGRSDKDDIVLLPEDMIVVP